MKKLFLVSAIVLGLGAMAPVFASETQITGDGSATKTGSMEITYGVASGYTVTIPADVDFTTGKTATRTIEASDVMIGYGKVLEVKVQGENYNEGWFLADKEASTNTLAYTLKSGDGTAITNNGVVLAVDAGNAGGSNELSFELIGIPIKAGEYADTLTFTVSVD